MLILGMIPQFHASVGQSLSCVQLFPTPWTAARQPPLSFTTSLSLLKPTSIELVMSSNHLIFCCPLLLLPSVFPRITVFFSESALHIRWPKYWSFSFSISIIPSNSLKASILCHSALFTVQLSHPYMTTRKTIALTIQTFVGKVMSLLLICCLGLL